MALARCERGWWQRPYAPAWRVGEFDRTTEQKMVALVKVGIIFFLGAAAGSLSVYLPH